MSPCVANITRTQRDLLFKYGIEEWPGVSARSIHGGLAELTWPPEVTPRLVFAVHSLTPARQLQQIKTHENLQIRIFNGWKSWRDGQ